MIFLSLLLLFAISAAAQTEFQLYERQWPDHHYQISAIAIGQITPLAFIVCARRNRCKRSGNRSPAATLEQTTHATKRKGMTRDVNLMRNLSGSNTRRTGLVNCLGQLSKRERPRPRAIALQAT